MHMLLFKAVQVHLKVVIHENNSSNSGCQEKIVISAYQKENPKAIAAVVITTHSSTENILEKERGPKTVLIEQLKKNIYLRNYIPSRPQPM